jgi:hypothetical protein
LLDIRIVPLRVLAVVPGGSRLGSRLDRNGGRGLDDHRRRGIGIGIGDHIGSPERPKMDHNPNMHTPPSRPWHDARDEEHGQTAYEHSPKPWGERGAVNVVHRHTLASSVEADPVEQEPPA